MVDPKKKKAIKKELITRRKKEEDRREKFVQARFTKKEYAALDVKAKNSNVKVSDLVRQAVTKTRAWTIENKKVQSEKVRQLARIGNNLNQIARFCNSYKKGADSLEIITHLTAIEHELKKVLR